uniref:Alternative protein OR2F1 n=1 Tax=Homo sapiens TaxID=9606 RepID=L8E9J5_HUMAN|nr:alternative protein OR2F1 [Homo sapiens]
MTAMWLCVMPCDTRPSCMEGCVLGWPSHPGSVASSALLCRLLSPFSCPCAETSLLITYPVNS